MRKTIDVSIAADGRDKGKTFCITEMPALQAEAWATRALFMLSKAGATIPDSVLSGGMASMAAMAGVGIQALLYVPYEDAKPLLDELMRCVRIKEIAVTRDLTPDDIEEIGTFFTLRGEALKLHVGFFPTAGA
jgi:hypothetical protein